MKKTLYVTILILLGLSVSCTNGIKEKISTKGDADEYMLDGNDKEMEYAINQARSTFGFFIKVNKNRQKNQSFFAVKYPFDFENGKEHLWLVDIATDSNRFYGTVNNEPELTKKVKCDQRIEFNPDSISDWKFIQGNTLVGGFTIKVIYNKLPEKEKEQFLKDCGFKIE